RVCLDRLGLGRFVGGLDQGLHALFNQWPLNRCSVTVVVRRAFVLAALVAAVLVPCTSASSASQIELAVVPPPKAPLGPAVHSLPLAHDSGGVSNAEAANEANGMVTAAQLKALGRVGGYLLDYGNPFGSSAGVSEIQTEVDRYRTAADARK